MNYRYSGGEGGRNRTTHIEKEKEGEEGRGVTNDEE